MSNTYGVAKKATAVSVRVADQNGQFNILYVNVVIIICVP